MVTVTVMRSLVTKKIHTLLSDQDGLHSTWVVRKRAAAAPLTPSGYVFGDRSTQVMGHDADSEEWVVEWLEGTTKERGTQLRLPRLRVYLKAEDPFNFADRVADAHASKEVRRKTLWNVLLVHVIDGVMIAVLEESKRW